MAIRRRHTLGVVACLALVGCNVGLKGLDETDLTPLATLTVQTTGDFQKLRPPETLAETPRLRVALVWAGVPDPDRFCLENALLGFGMPGDASTTAVVAAGCPDVLGFVPALASVVIPIEPGVAAKMDLLSLPTAEVLVGAPEGRVAYGSLVVFDDRNGNDALDLMRTQVADQGHGPGSGGGGGGGPGSGMGGDQPKEPVDFVYGASFVTMRQGHTRVAFREGTFDLASYFYPTIGCDPPAQGFSIRKVVGLPTASTCQSFSFDAQAVEIPLQATETVREVACNSVKARYRDVQEAPVLTTPWVCDGPNHLVVANVAGDCRGLGHFLLKGCEDDPNCETPSWDVTATPPHWWPCIGVPEKPKKP